MSTATGYKTIQEKLFPYAMQEGQTWYFQVNRADGEVVYKSFQRFATAWQAKDCAVAFIEGYQKGRTHV